MKSCLRGTDPNQLQMTSRQFMLAATVASFWLVVVVQGRMSEKCISQRCGSLAIPYPFGIAGSGCGHPDFQIMCRKNASFGSAGVFPFLGVPSGQLQILNISSDNLIVNSTHIKANPCHTTNTMETELALPPAGPFTFAGSNVFLAAGCEFKGAFFLGLFALNLSEAYNRSGANGYRLFMGGACTASCLGEYRSQCYGDNCCQIAIPDNWRFIQLQGQLSYVVYGCGYSTILEPETFSDNKYGLKLDWAIGDVNCSVATSSPSYACSEKSKCIDAKRGSGYLCSCIPGYSGDGYFNGTGCSDINECATSDLNNCVEPPLGSCLNLPGSYNCSCAKGAGDGFQSGSRCVVDPRSGKISTVSVLIGVFSTLIAGPLLGFVIYWILKRRRLNLLRKKHFRQNGGLRLQEYMSSGGGRKKANIFSAADLEKATNNFADEMQVGAGGYGHVYKGILTEGTSVAIKKCKEVGRHQIEQFVNEVMILSQIDHRNVVKLLGCCLETQVPLLVYEYVSNGTLYEHLQQKDGRFLTWENRIQIAIQTAEALAYLHSAASLPIVHRDVKSSNILLDSAGTSKLSDFGLSRLMEMGQTHLTTAVKGTLGYLDPQYFNTIQLTDKSDVYSFGVVLVELLSSMKPVTTDRTKEDRNLTNFFLIRKQSGLLGEVFDPQLVVENKAEDIESMTSVANLAEACLHPEADRRPSMKEVVQELLWIRDSRRSSSLHAWVAQNSDQHALDGHNEEASLLQNNANAKYNQEPKTYLINPSSSSSASTHTVFMDTEAMISLSAGR
eukprot:Gb_38348 [translate_table: standard]